MKQLVLYYSYSGHTKRLAEQKAQELGADIAPVLDVKRPGTAAAYSAGCLKAMQQKSSPIQPLAVDWADYGEFLLFSPVWASNLVPPINAVLEQLPKGAKVQVCAVSASGNSNKVKAATHIKKLGLELAGYEDSKG